MRKSVRAATDSDTGLGLQPSHVILSVNSSLTCDDARKRRSRACAFEEDGPNIAKAAACRLQHAESIREVEKTRA